MDTSSQIDAYLSDVIEQEQLSRKLWTVLSMTILAGVAVFIAIQ